MRGVTETTPTSKDAMKQNPTIDWNKYFDRAHWHPLANLFPVMTEEEIESLASDIKKNGLEDPIVLFEDKVLDGRNRLLAMELANLPLRQECFVHFRNVKDPKCSWGDCADSPLAWIVSKNLHRRHLTTSQRAAVAVEMEPLFADEAKKRQGARTDIKANLPESSTGQARDKAAAAMQVSPRSVQDAKKLKKEDPKAFEQVKAGKKTINAARAKSQRPPAVNELTETFYVIRRKSDGAFYQRGHDVGSAGRFVSNLFTNGTDYGEGFEVATPYVVDEKDEDTEIYWHPEGKRGRAKMARDEWEWVKVQATYHLTAVPQTKDSKGEEAA